MYTYEIDLCDEDGNTTHKGDYELDLDYQPEERVGGYTFVGESVSISSITGPDGESVDEDKFRAMVAEMNDIEIDDYKWHDFLLSFLDEDRKPMHYARWW